jgi:hypothetical protein
MINNEAEIPSVSEESNIKGWYKIYNNIDLS